MIAYSVHDVFPLDYRDNTWLSQSCELIEELTVKIGHSDPTHKLIQVTTGQVEDKNDTIIEHKPHDGDYCTEEKKKCCHSSEYLTVLPAYIRYSDLLMNLRRHHSLETTTKATMTLLLVKQGLKNNNYQSIHPIILHDHNYI